MMVYICGPITMGGTEVGPEHEAARLERIETAELVAAAVMKLGHAPVLTHSLCRHREALDSVTHEQAMAQCLELLRRCDAIALVEGWSMSEGCLAETEEADRLQKPSLIPGHGGLTWTRADALRILGER